ncbi:MAG: hypothetical protein ACHQ1D_01490 [Nitrososphaerales archaeon]
MSRILAKLDLWWHGSRVVRYRKYKKYLIRTINNGLGSNHLIFRFPSGDEFGFCANFLDFYDDDHASILYKNDECYSHYSLCLDSIFDIFDAQIGPKKYKRFMDS